MGDELDIRRAITRLPREDQLSLLELVGITPKPDQPLVDTLTAIALKTREPGEHELETPLGKISLHIGREGELLNARETSQSSRSGLVTGLPREERPTAFALIVSLANIHSGAFDATGKRDLVSLISSALGDALTRR